MGILNKTTTSLGIMLGMIALTVQPFSITSPVYAAGFAFKTGTLQINGQNNTDGEPQIRANKNGDFYISSERGLGAGTDAWKSTDGGFTYGYLGQPNALSQTQSLGVAPGGGDTDVAVATEKNSNGVYNTYIASLNLANIAVSTSQNSGKTFTTNYVSATVPVDDREWIAADGTSTVYLSYHDIVTTNIDVNKSTDAGMTWTKIGEAINPLSDSSLIGATNNNQLGNIAVDPTTHNVYQIFTTADGTANNTAGNPMNVVWMAVSTDGGQTFNDYRVYTGPFSSSYANQFPQVSVDRSGNAYAVFSDDHNVYYSVSSDKGKHWTKPVKVNSGSAITAIFPWSSALADGKIDIVYYGTSGTAVDGAAATNDVWYVYMTQVTNATTSSPKIVQRQVSATPVHKGGVCQGGISCGPTDNRDLYDDFGIAVSPTTGLASITFTSDYPTYNSSSEHTGYATQTSGPTIN
jgi:hypothetical protein